MPATRLRRGFDGALKCQYPPKLLAKAGKREHDESELLPFVLLDGPTELPDGPPSL
jgi:hypothetical protein